MYREEIADARLAADRYVSRASSASAAADSLARLADSLEVKVAMARKGKVIATAGSSVMKVRPGDSLWRLAARDTVYGDGRRWKELYEANRDRIRDADRIYPGQELAIPR